MKMIKKFLASMENPDFKRINFGIINRDDDIDLVEQIVDSLKSLNASGYIEYLDHEYVTDERLIDIDSYVRRRKKNKKREREGENLIVTKDDHIMTMYDSRYGELRARFKLSCGGREMIIRKNFLIPVKDKFGYYLVKGKKFFLIYQLVDSSTYAKGQSVILKTNMPVALNREYADITDTDGNDYESAIYTLMVYNRPINIFYLYFSQMGISALNFMGIDRTVQYVTEENEEDKNNYIYFKISSKLFIKVVRHLFITHAYLREMVASILDTVTNRVGIEDVYNRDFWIQRMGSLLVAKKYSQYERGQSHLLTTKRMIDESTKKILKLGEYNKSDIFTSTRWVVQNFNSLRRKDDVDLENKRLRANECITALFTHQLTSRVNNLTRKSRVIMDDVVNVFKIPGDVIIQQLHNSNLFQYDDRINDMDFWSKLKYTIKGPNSMGNKNPRHVASRYRDIHPSFLGRIDINVCGTSDPGLSGILTPWVKTDGLYFSDEAEPEDGVHEFEEAVRKYNEEVERLQGMVSIHLGDNSFKDKHKIKNQMHSITTGITVTRRYPSPDDPDLVETVEVEDEE